MSTRETEQQGQSVPGGSRRGVSKNGQRPACQSRREASGAVGVVRGVAEITGAGRDKADGAGAFWPGKDSGFYSEMETNRLTGD